MRRLAAVLAVAAVAAAGCAADDDGDAAATSASVLAASESTEQAGATVATTTTTTTTTVVDDAGSTTGAGCGEATDLEPGINQRTMTAAGGERTYLVWVPDAYDPAAPTPVVLTLHGAGSNKEQQVVYSGFTPLAQRDGVLVVAPDALGSPRAWAPFGALAEHADLDFVDDLLVELDRIACIDHDQLFAAGMSSGGLMSSALACTRSDLFGGFGPVTFTMYNPAQCAEGPPAPIISFHGTDDPIVPFTGEGRGGRGIPEVMTDWAARNGCDEEPVEEPLGDDVLHRRWTGCDATTELYVVEGGGHTWPGGIDLPQFGVTTRTVSAAEILWVLFFGDDAP